MSRKFSRFMIVTMMSALTWLRCAPDLPPDVKEEEERALGGASSTEPKEWTILVYAAADEESLRRPTLYGLKRMESVRALANPSRSNIVVQYDDVGEDPNYRYALSYTAKPTRKWQLDTPPIPEEKIRELDPTFRYGERNSSNPVTLKNFLNWAVRAYPARHYMLLLSGHSWGIQGHMQDYYYDGATRDGSALISNYELRRVLEEVYKDAGKLVPEGRFDVLSLDACITGQLEVALELKDVTHYLFSASLESPLFGIPYDRVMNSFLDAIAAAPGASAAETRRIIEQKLLVPMTHDYVSEHAPGGILVPLEKDISLTAAFALRTAYLEDVALALSELRTAFKATDGYNQWKRGNLRSLDYLADSDGHADLFELSQRLVAYTAQRYAETADSHWAEASDKASALQDALGYHVPDRTTELLRVRHSSAAGAWLNMAIDNVIASTDMAVCNALRTFTMENAGRTAIIPRLFDADGTELLPGSFYCDELAEAAHGKKSLDLSDGAKVAVRKIFDVEIVWPQGVPAYVAEPLLSTWAEPLERDVLQERIDARLSKKRILSIWIDRGTAATLDRRLSPHLPGVEAVDIEYLSGEPEDYILKRGDYRRLLLAEARVEVATYSFSADPAHFTRPRHPEEPGLYVAEGHSAGSHFKHGLGILFKRALSADFQPYMRGRKPVEQVESRPFSMLLDEYIHDLVRNGDLEKYPHLGPAFYSLHHIEKTGWSDFLFGPRSP